MICLKLIVCCNFLNLYGFYVRRYKSFLTNFSLLTQQHRSKINSDQKRLFFATTPFKDTVFVQRLDGKSNLNGIRKKETRKFCCQSRKKPYFDTKMSKYV